MNILVSIIIPTYNRNDMVQRAIKSALNQTYRNIEILVIDDSKEKTFSLIADKYSKIEKIKIYYTSGKGANFARNLGIEKSTGAYIGFLDDDDEYKYKKIEEQLNFMIKNDYKISYCWSETIDQNGKKSNYMPKFHGNIHNILLVYNFVRMLSLLIKKDIITDEFLFDNDLKQRQDWDFIIRLSKKHSIGLVNKILFIVYKHNSDSIGKSYKAYDSTKQIFLKYRNDLKKIIVLFIFILYTLKNKNYWRLKLYFNLIWLNRK